MSLFNIFTRIFLSEISKCISQNWCRIVRLTRKFIFNSITTFFRSVLMIRKQVNAYISLHIHMKPDLAGCHFTNSSESSAILWFRLLPFCFNVVLLVLFRRLYFKWTLVVLHDEEDTWKKISICRLMMAKWQKQFVASKNMAYLYSWNM